MGVGKGNSRRFLERRKVKQKRGEGYIGLERGGSRTIEGTCLLLRGVRQCALVACFVCFTSTQEPARPSSLSLGPHLPPSLPAALVGVPSFLLFLPPRLDPFASFPPAIYSSLVRSLGHSFATPTLPPSPPSPTPDYCATEPARVSFLVFLVCALVSLAFVGFVHHDHQCDRPTTVPSHLSLVQCGFSALVVYGWSVRCFARSGASWRTKLEV